MDFSLTESNDEESPKTVEAVPLLLPPQDIFYGGAIGSGKNQEKTAPPKPLIHVVTSPSPTPLLVVAPEPESKEQNQGPEWYLKALMDGEWTEWKPESEEEEPEIIPVKLIRVDPPEPEKPKNKGGRPRKQPEPEMLPEPPGGGRQPLWHPEEHHYRSIFELSELGWPVNQIAEALNVTPQQFHGAMVRYPRVKEEFERGAEVCKGFEDKRLAWRPTRGDLHDVEFYASKGLRYVEIAAKLSISRQALTARMQDTPQLKDAYERGEGTYRANLIKDSEDLLAQRDSDTKNCSSLMIFKLKAHCELNDRPEVQKVELQGEVNHVHQAQFTAPQQVKVDELAEFSRLEMERAKQERDRKANEPKLIEAEVL